MTDTSPRISAVFLPELPKTLPVTTLMLFGPVTLLCGTFLFMLPLRAAGFSIHTGEVHQCCATDTTSGGTS